MSVSTAFIVLSYLARNDSPNEKDAHSFLYRTIKSLERKGIKNQTLTFHGCMRTYEVKCEELKSMLFYWETNHFIDVADDEHHSIKINDIFIPTIREFTPDVLEKYDDDDSDNAIAVKAMNKIYDKYYKTK